MSGIFIEVSKGFSQALGHDNKSMPTNLQLFIPVSLQSTSEVDKKKAYKSTAFSF